MDGSWLPILAFGVSLFTGKWWIFAGVMALEIFWFFSFNGDLGRSRYDGRCASECSDPNDKWSCCECTSTGTYFPGPTGDPEAWDYERRFSTCMGESTLRPLSDLPSREYFRHSKKHRRGKHR